MGAEEKARREIIEAGLAEIATAKAMADQAVRHALIGSTMVAHMAVQSLSDKPKPKGQKRPRKAKRPDHHR